MSAHDPSRSFPCDCPLPATAPTPRLVHNRPALSAISYRVGTYDSFLRAMTQSIADMPALSELGTRAEDDYAVVLLRMWAYLGDILTFYQERIANEAYLRTAKLPETVRRLARQVSYRPSPGLSARTDLAFLLDAGAALRIPKGLRVQSVPGHDEKPQKYETLGPVDAVARLNEIRILPQPVGQTPLAPGSTFGILDHLHTESIIAELVPGDNVVAYQPATNCAEDKTITHIVAREWGTGLHWEPPMTAGLTKPVMRKWTRKFRLFGHNAPSTFLVATVSDGGPIEWKEAETKDSLDGAAPLCLDAVYDDLRVGSELLVVAGGTAKALLTVSSVAQSLADVKGKVDNKEYPMPAGEATVTCVSWQGGKIEKLDTRSTVIYELRGPEVTLSEETCVTPMPVESIQLPTSVAGYVDGRLRRQTPKPPSDLAERLWPDTIRLLEEYDGQLPLPGSLLDALLAEAERASTEGGTLGVTLEGSIDPKCAGRAPIWGDAVYVPLETLEKIEAGRRITIDDASHTPETVTVLSAVPYCPEGEGQRPEYLRITFTPALSRVVDGTTAVLYGNVAPASHGETIRDEILGDGDPSLAYQSFELARAPVAHLPQPDAPGGVRSTLEVWVNEVLWGEVPSLYSYGPDARVYTTTEDGEGLTTIRLGDGKSGARLPRGRANIVARYRQGLGREGEVPAGALTTLLDRPVGLKSVTNPAPGSDGADPKSMHTIRADAPNTVRTFDRVVSLRDFEDVARAYPGIAKAKAACTWDEGQRVVLLTVVGDDGDRIEDAARRDLRAHLDARRDRYRPLLIRPHEPVAVTVKVGIWVAPDRSPDVVQQATLEALEAYFAFDTQDLGKTIHLSGLYAVIRAVEGVAGSDIDHLGYKVDTIAQLPKTAAPHLPMESWQIAYVESPADLTVDVRTNGL